MKMVRLMSALGVAVALSALSHAGTITGAITFEGKVPEMKPVAMDADPACAAMHKDNPPKNEILVLGDGQTMANVLVEVTKGAPQKDYPAPTEPIVLTQKGCMYSPRVFVIRPGQTLKVMNPDGILHNVNGMPAVNTPFNRAMPKNLTEMEVTFDKSEPPFQIRCDIHAWMRSYCAVLNHSFYSVTAKDGVYKIEGLEPGEYEIQAWHERLGTQTAKVTIPATGDATQNFTFAPPTKKER